MCDLILFNANVITMDPVSPRAGLVGVRGERIALVTANKMLGRLRKPGTRIIDCKGKTLLPGFIDAHCHVRAYAENLVSLNLSPRGAIHSISDIQDKIRDICRIKSSGTWIRGKSFNEFYIKERRFLNRWDLDVAAPLHPVKITHRSGHAHILNSIALKFAGISRETGDSPGGMIDRDPETGIPTGILYGMGAYLAEKVPPLDDRDLERGVMLANEKLLSCGITSIQDASSANGLQQWKWFEALKERKALQPRLTVMTGLTSLMDSQRDSFSSHIDNIHFRLGGIKIVADQVTGCLRPSQKELNEQVSTIHEAGLQAVIHAVEEPVIEASCNAIAYALKHHYRHDHRHRIEHCSVCPPPLLRRLAGLNIAIVTQPAFVYFNGDQYLKTVPVDQLEHLYVIGSMVRNGLSVGFSSDFPISDPNPLVGVCAAVTRMTEGNERVLPREGILVADALRMCTIGAAAAAFEEKIKGSISPGKVADLVMVSEDPFAIPSPGLKDIQVMMTILGGRVVWEGQQGGGPTTGKAINLKPSAPGFLSGLNW
jgi:predicted amidohydrolase YtcJ